ncbi:spore germination protein KC [Fontibacillus panacisegetis]|uniref:Spore germination protein KC n=1 Tax=Fontibacillus panacisegetis TaxID=670482 RepID=A0A1G7FV84_9BACL|nr:Ger(x)C family spore germination protein [Fontibacillus panacisegetis]SDE79771.1 spore germination protein KC [Fontibacillus panacisegetis]
MNKGSRKRSRRGLLAILSFSLATAGMTACWDNRELNELGIVSGSAYDREDGQWVTTYQIINPSATSSQGGGGGGQGGPSPPFLTFTERGSTIMEAVARSNLTSTRQLYFAHSRITVINEKVAREGIAQLLDLFLRKPDASETVNVFLSERRAGDILNQLMQITKNQGTGIQLMIQQESELTSYYQGIKMFELSMALSSESHCAAIPEIKLTNREIINKIQEAESTDLPTRIALGRLGILKKDRFIGWMSDREAFGLSFMTDKINSAIIPFTSDPEHNEKLDASANLMDSKTIVRPVWEGDHFVMDIDVKGNAMLLELKGKADLSKPAEVSKFERNIEQNILEYINRSWRTVKKLGADVTMFAPLIHRAFPKRWEHIEKEGNWDTVFQEIEIRPRVSISIDRFGLSSKSYKSVEQD